jgi:hypothetical protein
LFVVWPNCFVFVYLDVKLGSFLVGLDHIAPVEEVIVVDHPTAEVRLEKKKQKSFLFNSL